MTIPIYNKFIKSSDDLVTSRDSTRAGFVAFALEKNRIATPLIEQAKVLKTEASKAEKPSDLLNFKNIQTSLLTASGLSDKSLQYFDDKDKLNAIQNLIDNFLEPAGSEFINELIYRFLLIKGDSLGGSMRNIIGFLAEQKFLKSFIASLSILGIEYKWLRKSNPKKWENKPNDETIIYNDFKAIYWRNLNNEDFVLIFNMTIPKVNKNVDISIFNRCYRDFQPNKIKDYLNDIILLGEIKGGIDPAGADEHWKTANSALNRIRNAKIRSDSYSIKTAFIGAAIEKSMSKEIFTQLESGQLSNAANLLIENQLNEICLWLATIKL